MSNGSLQSSNDMSDDHNALTLREMQLLSQQKLDMLIATVERLSGNVEQRLTAGDRRFGELELWKQSANNAITNTDQRVRSLEDAQRTLRDARPVARIEALEADMKPLLAERAAHQAQLKLVTILFGTPLRVLVTIGSAVAIALLTHWIWP
jgi:chromosome segregation ATPase